jgi:hypothetical protein
MLHLLPDRLPRFAFSMAVPRSRTRDLFNARQPGVSAALQLMSGHAANCSLNHKATQQLEQENDNRK